jgi:hypothetical protein
MWGRLCVVVVAIGLTACGLLHLRQARLQAAHELAAAHERVRLLEENTLRLRADLVGRIGDTLSAPTKPAERAAPGAAPGGPPVAGVGEIGGGGHAEG